MEGPVEGEEEEEVEDSIVEVEGFLVEDDIESKNYLVYIYHKIVLIYIITGQFKTIPSSLQIIHCPTIVDCIIP